MSNIDRDFILKSMHESRKAQRNWSNEKIDQETIDFLIEIATNAPSKQNEVDFTLAVITNEQKLKEHEARFTWGYHWDKTNSAMHNTQVHAPLIFIYGKTLPEDLYEDIWGADEEGEGINESFEETFRDTQNKSAGISAGQLVLAAHMIGLKTGFNQNTTYNGETNSTWKEWLGYKQSDYYEPMFVVGIGHPDPNLPWYETDNLEYVVADPKETGLTTKGNLDIKSNDIRQYPLGDVFEFEPRSSEYDGTPIQKNVKVKKFF